MKRSVVPVLITTFVLAFFYLPIGVLVVNSFNAAPYGSTWGGFSLKWYYKLLTQKEILLALKNTLIIATSSTIASTLIGTLAALALHRYHTRLQSAHYALIYTPLVVPEILTGMSLLLFFVALGLDLGLFTIFLAHVTFCISYVAMVVLARLQDFDFNIIEAAQDLGASWMQIAVRVLLPLIAPGVLAGALLALTLSVDDFVITFFVAGPGATTLPLRIYSMIKHGHPPLLNVLSTILLVVTFLLVWLSQRVLKRKQSL